MTSYRLGVDTGGTFTDFVLWHDGHVRIHKVLSTPLAPEQAILQGIDEMGLASVMASGDLAIVHGSTVATNAALEGKGARTLFITNAGLEDLLCIGRQARAELYNLTPLNAPSPLDQLPVMGVQCRRDATGAVVLALTDQELARVREQVLAYKPEAIAISLLFDYLNDDDEQRLQAALQDMAPFVCSAAEVLPLAGEYERGVATWLNAWLGPRVEQYLTRLTNLVGDCSLAVMQSHAGTISVAMASRRAVNLLLSGPAGGLCAAREVAAMLSEPRVLTFDMGGTSTDVAMIDGDIRLTLEGRIGAWPVAVPMVDMHTIGAGGGSIASVDEAGMLHVGPASAGALPGPACYDRGGEHFTVTDANLLAGRLQADFVLGGSMSLNVSVARSACQRLAQNLNLSEEDTVAGVLALANEHMAQALRVISIQKGADPASFTLLSFGGAGGLHVCDLADMLSMRRAIVPANSGVLSAQGMLQASPQRELIRAVPSSANDMAVSQLASALAEQGRSELVHEGHINVDFEIGTVVEMRYQGQSFCLSVPWTDGLAEAERAFHLAHEVHYGHRMTLPVVAVNLRVWVRAQLPPLVWPAPPTRRGEPVGFAALADCTEKVPVYARQSLAASQVVEGPALIIEPVATTLIKLGWQAQVLTAGHILLTTR